MQYLKNIYLISIFLLFFIVLYLVLDAQNGNPEDLHLRHTKSSQATIRYLTAFQPRVRRSVYFFQPQLILWTSTISHVFQPLISDTR